jgi:hypothetical protein
VVPFLSLMTLAVLHASPQPLRPPAVPLVTFDPYLSIWSGADRLTDDVTRHWTRREYPLVSLIRVDGQAFRLMGSSPKEVSAFPQVGLQVTPTRSLYDFDDGKIHVTLTFLRPALPFDLDAVALPLTFLTWQVRSIDGRPHAVSIYDSTGSQLAVNQPDEQIEWARGQAGDLTALRVGTVEQPLLGSSGDDHRINWGYVYAAAASRQASAAVGPDQAMAAGFIAGRTLPGQDDRRMPRAANDDPPTMAFVFDLGNVAAQAVTRQVIVAYDEVYAVKYFGRRLRPYWRRQGATPEQMLQQASRAYSRLVQRCAEFDSELLADARKVGGEGYAQICALAYRQCMAACGLAADAHGQPLLFPKENTSNGCVSTVDVLYPMAPMFMLLSPTLAKGSLVPIFVSTVSGRHPAAPHDLGTYPLVRPAAEGEGPMPVEETGNMIILCDAIAHAQGSADFVAPWWPRLTVWAQYLEQYGMDPANQLCTDDFMGHLAHNANLSVKAILGLAAYGDLCRRRGDRDTAERYASLAKADAEHWVQAAGEGDHYRLAFDQANTWSQKYNLVWDRILGLNVFPPEVAAREVAYYQTRMQRYGLPLDSRTKLTKTDWSLWSASLAEKTADFEAMISPIVDYLNQTTARSPFVDSYVTDDIRSDGMRARPVIGGVFVKMLTDRKVWTKWARRDKTRAGPWAPLPAQPRITEVVPTSREQPFTWRYVVDRPADDWAQPGFNASQWREGPAGFGTIGTPGTVVRTQWSTQDIWLRRTFVLPPGEYSSLRFYVHHDEDVEIYLNGVPAATEGSFTTNYGPLEIRPPAMALLRPGAEVLLAVHCHQTGGGQYIDVGLARVAEPGP